MTIEYLFYCTEIDCEKRLTEDEIKKWTGKCYIHFSINKMKDTYKNPRTLDQIDKENFEIRHLNKHF